MLSKNKKMILDMAVIAVFLACGIVLSRFFSLTTPLTKISFSFVPLLIVARYYGTKGGIIVAGLGDLIGALLFPFGIYFPLYTISEALRGYIFGVFLSKPLTVRNIIFSVLITQIFCSLILNCFAMTIFYESFRPFVFEKYLYFVGLRLPQVIVMIVVEIAVGIPLLKRGDKIFKKVIIKA